MKALILDDGSEGLEQILAWLSENKDVMEVSAIKQPDVFIERAETEKPDLVFIKIGPADISGLQIGRIIKDTDPEISIVFISDDLYYAIDAFEVGAYGYLHYPVDKKKLETIIKNKNAQVH